MDDETLEFVLRAEEAGRILLTVTSRGRHVDLRTYLLGADSYLVKMIAFCPKTDGGVRLKHAEWLMKLCRRVGK